MCDYKEFLSKCKEPVEAYIRGKRKKDEEGINPFKLVSDFYYRETFHTDILLELLNPKGSHKEGNRFLDLFIEALNNEFGWNINLEYYEDAEVTPRGYGTAESKPDIVIVSKDKPHHCIIIENKLNNAEDQEKQIPRYYTLMHKEMEVDGIVYIPLDETKRPDEKGWSEYDEGWTEEDNNNVHKLTRILTARLLIDKWLTPCLKEAKHYNSNATIKLYIELLESLIMEDKSTGELFRVLCEGDNANIFKELMELQKKLPNYMARLIQAEFPNKTDYCPFEEASVKDKGVCYQFMNCKLNGSPLRLNVVCSYEEGFRLDLYDGNNDETKAKDTEKILQEDSMKIKNLAPDSCKFTEENEKDLYTYYRFVFSIADFDKVIEFIKKILSILTKAQKNENMLNEE